MTFGACPQPWGNGRIWIILLAKLLVGAAPAAAQVVARALPPQFFQADAPAARVAAASLLVPQLRQYRAYTLNLASLRTALAAAPLGSATAQPLQLSLPMPNGTFQRFAVWEAPVLTPALATRYPALHTYGGRGVDDPTALLSLTVSPSGVQAQVLTDQDGEAAYLQTASQGDPAHYLSYYAHDVSPPTGGRGACGTGVLPQVNQPAGARRASGPGNTSPGGGTSNFTQPVGPTLTVYRLVMTTTKEYTASIHNPANGSDYTDVASNVAALVNNVRTIQERDLAITMTVVGTHFYTLANDGGYNQADDFQMIDQNRRNVETEFGASAYDLGHLLSTSGSGLAYVGVVANPVTGGSPYTYKAGAVSGNQYRTAPLNFITSVFAHEIGHQFSAGHTFNTTQGSCSGSRSSVAAWEPGKGSTIMAYSDVDCDSPANNVIQAQSDPYYHTGSVEQIRNYIETIPGSGLQLGSGNSVPILAVPLNRTIPQGTPFKLTAVGADADADDGPNLRYNWEEMDLGSAANLSTAQVPNDNVPLFRSVLPSTGGATRYFPSLNALLSGAAASPTERLPTVARTLQMRCTVRDYHAVTGTVAASTTSRIVGGVALSSTVTLTVSAANATPFAVTQPNAAVVWASGSTQTVQWNGVGTRSSAVNCQSVNIRLSTDGGQSYPTLLAAGVPNVDGTGSASITLPAVSTTAARIMVEAADNYFFDISDTNFTITNGPIVAGLSPASGPVGTSVTISGRQFGASAAGLSVTFNGVPGTITSAVTDTQFTATVPDQALTGPVVVTRAGASPSNAGTFAVTPVVSGINPASGAEGTTVVISGSALGGATRASFNGALVLASAFLGTNYFASPNTITLVVPTGATSGPVVVTTAGGVSNATVSFAVTSFTFSVLGVSPALNATAAEGTNITARFNSLVGPSNATTVRPLKAHSLQAGGLKAGTSSVSGQVLTLDPATDFRAGEVVQVSVAPGALAGTNEALATGYVSQFTTRTRPTTGLSDGRFFLAGARPEHVVAGALNADASLDLVVVNQSANTVSILLNNGEGTAFTAAAGSPIAVGFTPQGAALADLNNDGVLDLLVACMSGTINVLKGNGDGTFAPQASLTNLGPVQMVTVGDLNGDGNLDFVAPVLYSNVGYASVGMGNGNFGFSVSDYTGLSVAPRSLALADFNEDGKLDLVAACYGGSNFGSVCVRFGNGAGSFSFGINTTVNGAYFVAAADLNADGHVDFASTNTFDSNAPINVWMGTGVGTFGPAATLRLNGGFAYTLSTGDYNGDGTIDLIAPRSGFTFGAGVDVFTYANGAFSAATTLSGFGNQPRYVALADLNGDRTLDMVTANSVGDNTVSVALGIAENTLPLPVELSAFTATAVGEAAVRLAWLTASERNSKGFEIERSQDGRTFSNIGFVAGAGSSNTARSYSLLDKQLPPDATLLYYRLRQVDLDGTAAYSPVRSVALTKAAEPPQLLVYPNPARGTVRVRLVGLAPAGPLQVIDAVGRTVRTLDAMVADAEAVVPLTGLAPGFYVLRCGGLSQRLAVE